jgi:hypothetical protein
MKPSMNRWRRIVCLGCLGVAGALAGCKGNVDETKSERLAQSSEATFSVRQVRMKEVSAICGRMHKALKRGV